MPIDLIAVTRIDTSDTRTPGTRRHLVTGVYVSGKLGWFQASTTNDFIASLCDQAAKKQWAARVTWKDWPGGKAITFVELQPAAPKTEVA